MNQILIYFFATTIFFNVTIHCSQAQKDTPELSIASIPNQLFVGSKAIVREENFLFEIVDDQEARVSVKKVVTFLDKSGINYYPIKIYYDQLTKVNKINGQLYDKNGVFIRKIKRFDIDDVSAISGFSIYEDSRVKIVDLEHKDFPFTLVLEYDLTTNDLLHLPHWKPVDKPGVSLEVATFVLRFPEQNNVSYKGLNVAPPLEETLADQRRQYTWQVREFKAIKGEPMMIFDRLFPEVRTAMKRINYNGITGISDSWNNLGKYFWGLNESGSALPEALVSDLERIRESAKGDQEIIKKINRYLKENTRYVSVQVGLGNLRPLSPELVFKNKYGDCKALCNYAKAMLNYFGIHSIYTLVNTLEDFQPDLVTDQFDHVVLCIPNRGDTIWMECTDPDLPFDYLGEFSMGKDALLITENGGVLTKTQDLYPFQNCRTVKTDCKIFENGRAEFNTEVKYNFLEFEQVKHLVKASREERMKEYYQSLGMSDIDIRSIELSQKEDAPKVVCELSIASNRFSVSNGDHIIFPAIPFFQEEKPVTIFNSRMTPFEIKNSSHYTDSIYYSLPEEYLKGTWPEDRTIESEFGTYSIAYELLGGKILVVRNRKIKDGVFTPEKYAEYVNYINQIAELEKQKIILTKN